MKILITILLVGMLAGCSFSLSFRVCKMEGQRKTSGLNGLYRGISSEC